MPHSWEDIRNGTALRGAGQRFRIEAVPGTQVQRYMINFQEPYLFDTPGQPRPERLLLRPASTTNGARTALGGRVSLGYQFTHDLSGSLSPSARRT